LPWAATHHFYRSRVLLYRKRDGNLRGLLAALLMSCAAVLSLPAAAINSLLRRPRTRRPRFVLAALGGIASGVGARSHAALRYRG
jgi:hypothetical protein